MGYKLNLQAPQTFNEKLNWMKLYDRRPEYTTMADKLLAKEYFQKVIGPEYVVPIISAWDDPSQINFDSLPERFVLKCNHNSGRGMFICREKSKIDYEQVRKELLSGLKEDYFLSIREWPYKNIKRKIIAEQYLEDPSSDGGPLIDFKFYCFNGRPEYMYRTIKSQDSIFENFYDMNGKPVDIDHGFPRREKEFDMSANFHLMQNLAAKISRDIPFLRVDFFEVNGKVYAGECTFYDWGGMRPFNGEWDLILGKKIQIPPKNYLR